MGNFEEHVQFGYIAMALFVLTSPLYFAIIPFSPNYILFILFVFIGLGTTFIGAVFPDVDHHASKPYRFVRKSFFGLSVLVMVIVLVRIYMVYEVYLQKALKKTPYLLVLGAAGVVASVSVGIAIVNVLDYIQPKHRGITHSLSLGVAISIILVVIGQYIYTMYNINSLTTVLSGWGFLLGFMSHLYCDGILP